MPDFIIAGAPRCATTWLYELAERHPDLAMAKPLRPEPKFFLVDDLYERGLDYYSEHWFANLPEGRKTGEKSTNYLENPHAALRIRDALPDVKLVFMLRDPVDRAWSNYRWSCQNGLESENFQRALALETERAGSMPAHLRYVRPNAYFSRGLYAEMLAPYMALFGQQQILVLRQEDGRDSPGLLAQTFHRFLGVEPRPTDATGIGRINAAVDETELDSGLRAHLAALYAEPNRRLAALLGPDFRIW